jgi:hypothetical protein
VTGPRPLEVGYPSPLYDIPPYLKTKGLWEVYVPPYLKTKELWEVYIPLYISIFENKGVMGGGFQVSGVRD